MNKTEEFKCLLVRNNFNFTNPFMCRRYEFNKAVTFFFRRGGWVCMQAQDVNGQTWRDVFRVGEGIRRLKEDQWMENFFSI